MFSLKVKSKNTILENKNESTIYQIKSENTIFENESESTFIEIESENKVFLSRDKRPKYMQTAPDDGL